LSKRGPPRRSRAAAEGGSVQPITWSKFRIYDVKDSDLDESPARAFPHVPGALYKAVNGGIKEPACQVNFEDFFPGPAIEWFMSHDEVHYVTSGEAEIVAFAPPLHKEETRVIARAGSVYLLPRGLRVTWRVLGEAPFRHVCICFPDPGYPTPLARSVAQAEGR
jgi:hypothetical protein